MIIYKEKLPQCTEFPGLSELPFSSVKELKNHVLKIDTQYGEPVVWFQADDDSDGIIKENHKFFIQGVGTGHSYTGDEERKIINKDSYIGTASLNGGSLILHYFAILCSDISRTVSNDDINE